MTLWLLVSALLLYTSVLFMVYLEPHFHGFFFFLVISLFKMAPKLSAEVQSGVSKLEKAGPCLMLGHIK